MMDRDRLQVAEAKIGGFLHALHALDNDWFGRQGTPDSERLYTWQEAFILALEELLDAASSRINSQLSLEDLRLALSRAIGAYIFEDVEWPSFVCFSRPRDFLIGDDGELVCALATGVPRAVWGDPLMEPMFARPSRSMVAAYKGETEGDGMPTNEDFGLTTFSRQRTKKLWYGLYAMLLDMVDGSRQRTEESISKLVAFIKEVRNAPCY
jgi:hypothetical protein